MVRIYGQFIEVKRVRKVPSFVKLTTEDGAIYFVLRHKHCNISKTRSDFVRWEILLEFAVSN